MGERIRYDLRQQLFNHLQTLSLSYYSRTPVGWIMARVTTDSERVAELVTWGLIDSTWGVVNIVTTLAFMFAINWQLALIVLAIIPVLLYRGSSIPQSASLSSSARCARSTQRSPASYNENITGVRVVKALGREDEQSERIQRADRRYVSGRLPRRLAERAFPARLCRSSLPSPLGGIIWYSGVAGQYRRHHRGRHPGFCFSI